MFDVKQVFKTLNTRLTKVEARSLQNEENILNLQSIATASEMREKRLSCHEKFNWTNEKGVTKNLFNIAESKPTLYALAVAKHLWPADDNGISDLMKYRIVDNPSRDRASDRPQMTGPENLAKQEMLKSIFFKFKNE